MDKSQTIGFLKDLFAGFFGKDLQIQYINLKPAQKVMNITWTLIVITAAAVGGALVYLMVNKIKEYQK